MKSFGLIVFILGFSLPVMSQTALEIVQKMDDQMTGESSKGEVVIQIQRPKWEREMHMKMWSLGDDYSMTIVTSPASEKGIGFLKRETEVWNWIPSVERLIKLPPSMMMQSWMGTDFTNDDLVRQSSLVTDYDHEIVGKEVLENRTCWILVLTPHEDAPVVWGKVKIWVDQEDYLQLKVAFYDEDEELVSTMLGSDIKEMDGRMLASRLEMKPANKPNQKTVFIQKNIEFNVDLGKDFFTPQQLKRLRP